MVQFKNKTVKIVFYVIFSLLTIIFGFMVLMAFIQPASNMGIGNIVMTMLFVYLLPLLLLIQIFTRPTPRKNKPDKKTRLGIWIPISAFLFLSLLSALLMTIQSGNRCKIISPGGNLWDCDFAGMDLSGRDLQGANMERIDLTGANLSGADLSGVNLSNANLPGIDLSNVDLSNAILFQAKVDGADLSGAVLEGANLQLASLVNVKGLTDESLANLGDWRGLRLQDEDELLALLFPVCSGKAVSTAAEYMPDKYANSMMLIDSEGEMHALAGGEGVWGTYWLPESVSNTELVACFAEAQKIGVGTCTYDDGTSMERYMQRVEISIYAAKTGELINTISLDGPRPTACPEKIVAGDEPDYVGDPPYGKTVVDTLRPFINEGGELPPLNLP
jgi:hypothetical protein